MARTSTRRAQAEKAHTLDHGYAHLGEGQPDAADAAGTDPHRACGPWACKLGVATNDSHVSARNHMAHIGVIEHFEDIIAADTVPVPKPSGNMIRRFAEITGLPAASIAMVGDNHHDMEEARNGGAGLAIAVLSAAMPRTRTSRISPTTRSPASPNFPPC